MTGINNYIESQYRELSAYINIEYIDLYSTFSNRKLQEIFSTIHHLFATNYKAMNSRLPTGEYGNHFWADNSRELLLAIEVLKGLERVLQNTDDAFELDSYYEGIVDKSMNFLEKSGGSTIPPKMDKIYIYYTDPILHKRNSILLNSTPVEKQTADLKRHGGGSYADVFTFYDSFYNRKFALKRAKPNLNEKELERFKQEYEQMRRLSSPYIVEVFCFDGTKHEYIMEYMDYTISDYIINSTEKPSIEERKRLISQIFQAFKYIHSKEILHRDISPCNILIKNYEDVKVIKIADFGLVKVPENHLTSIHTEFKGSFNDPALMSEGFNNYNTLHETYALTKLVAFVMTGSAWPNAIEDAKLKEYIEKGISPDKSKRYQSVDEMISAFRKL